MSKIAAALATVREHLADTQIYAEEHREALEKLLLEEGKLQAQADTLDETWLEQQQALEELDAGESASTGHKSQR